MSNRLTRVPDEAVPAITGPVRHLVPLADLFLVAMLSRPRTGSLRSTWVTPATRVLATAVAALAVAALPTVRLAGGWSVLVAVLLVFMAVGAGAVALVGLSQGRARTRGLARRTVEDDGR